MGAAASDAVGLEAAGLKGADSPDEADSGAAGASVVEGSAELEAFMVLAADSTAVVAAMVAAAIGNLN